MMADKNLYRITYDNGSVKHGRRHILGCVLGARVVRWSKRPVKIERAPEPGWEDVTAEFLGEE